MRLVADANVLLAAVLGGRAKAVLQHPEVEEVLTAEVTFAEVQEYAVILARRRRLSFDTLLLAMAALPDALKDVKVFLAHVMISGTPSDRHNSAVFFWGRLRSRVE